MVELDNFQPLDVMLRAMRALLRAGKIKEAADIAKAAAPYVHPRATGRARMWDLALLRDEDIDGATDAGGGGTGAAAEDTDEPDGLD